MLITIRDAEDHDVHLLADLNRFVQDLHVAALPEYFKHPESGAVAESFRSRLHRPDVRVWIAHMGDGAVGYAVSVLRERAENALCLARRFYELEEIAVSLAHRRQGVARALVERVLTEARLQGVPDVELTSWAFNVDAHAAFQALGFWPMIVRLRHESDAHE
ncbi:MAG TPA: GNAT family N-acetyltransferase [Polyangiaceae bacterium]|nr:GNAT family N-acetyltransferase [Polyangiaceae bacterium]